MRSLRLPLAATIACIALASTAGGAATAAPESATPVAKKSCGGSFASKSVFRRTRVVVIRGVSCKTAEKVAKAYDNQGRTASGWACGLAHGGGSRLFSCGKGVRSGSLTSGRSAFVAYGTGGRG